MVYSFSPRTPMRPASSERTGRPEATRSTYLFAKIGFFRLRKTAFSIQTRRGRSPFSPHGAFKKAGGQDPEKSRPPPVQALTAVPLPSSRCSPRTFRNIPSDRPRRRIGRSNRPCRYSASAPGTLRSAPPQRHCQGHPR